jgi:hypothetical protein
MEIGAIADSAGAEAADPPRRAANMSFRCAIPNAIYMETSGQQRMVKKGKCWLLKSRA